MQKQSCLFVFSPAWRRRFWDRVGGRPVDKAHGLQRVMLAWRAGAQVAMTLHRRGAMVNVTVVPSELSGVWRRVARR
jgi:hypothetical protein